MKLLHRVDLVVAAAGVHLHALGEPKPKPKPNVVIVLRAKQGYGDLSLTGNPILKTPKQAARTGR